MNAVNNLKRQLELTSLAQGFSLNPAGDDLGGSFMGGQVLPHPVDPVQSQVGTTVFLVDLGQKQG
ncbi:MAG: hypothetical protein HC889_20255 [Synechococcaceae cyanobacterium SM1_2_3]|nr:hypothetical protein [Synechococcaceae cyanobacterium SM1_2_3]